MRRPVMIQTLGLEQKSARMGLLPVLEVFQDTYTPPKLRIAEIAIFLDLLICSSHSEGRGITMITISRMRLMIEVLIRAADMSRQVPPPWIVLSQLYSIGLQSHHI